MAYASNLRRMSNGRRWPGSPSGAHAYNEYKAKHRPIGFMVAEARVVLRLIEAAPSDPAGLLKSARKKLEDWIARYESNTLQCLHCGYCWVSPLRRGTTPKRCQMCGGYADVGGETMIIAATQEPR